VSAMYKVVFGSFRLLIGIALLGSVAWQVLDRLANNIFRPTEYFAYFSIVGSIATGVLSLVVGAYLLLSKSETKFLNIARLSAAAAMVLIGVVYHALLADAASDVRDGDYAWPVLPNEIIHTYAPIAVAIEYLISLRSPKLRLRAALWVTVFPLAWLGFSIVRGLATNWWPYWFINPNGDGGVGTVVFYVSAITIFFIMLGFLIQGLRLVLSKTFKI
jgi:hypothetical protein